MTDVLIESVAEGVSMLTLNRPKSLNSLTENLVEELDVALEQLSSESSCRVIILTGAGKGFCSGHDLAELAEHERESDLTVQRGMASQESYAALTTKIQQTPIPVIAAVNGVAAGAGLALALAADIRLCSTDARFSAAFIKLGLSGCDVGVSYLLPRIVGPSLAFEMMLTGRLIDAEEAERSGLVLESIARAKLLPEALNKAVEIAAKSPFGVKMTKSVMWSNLDAPSLDAAIALENRTQILCVNTEDHKEALSAFTERRAAEFSNR